MKVSVTDDTPGIVRRLMVDEPRHGALQPAEVAVGDATGQAGEVAVDADQVAADRWPLAVERRQQDLRIEGMELQLHVDQH
jgi:hypothetical protein